MENSEIDKEYQNQRPGVSEEKSSKIDGRVNEEASAVSDGPFRGRRDAVPPTKSLDQVARSAPCRILISHASNLKLDEVTVRTNSDFEGGQITRPQILEWLLSHFAQNITEAEIEKIRATYFDRVAYLECLLKRAKETGIAPPELNALFAGKAMAGKLKRKAPGHSDPEK